MTDDIYNDHDLLVLIAERTRVASERLTSLEDRVTTLERDADKRSGFISGANWLWTFIITAPPSAVALFLGTRQ